MIEVVDRAEQRVQWLAARLRLAIERDAADEEMDLVRAMFGIHRSSNVIWTFRAWLAARARYRTSDPRAPDHDWLRREMDRLCDAYQAAVGEAQRP